MTSAVEQASDMVRLFPVGTGHYVPENTVTSDAAMGFLGIPGKDGSFMRDRLNINRRHLNWDPERGILDPEESDIGMAYKAAIIAMKDAGIGPSELCGIVHVSCTGGKPHFQTSIGEMMVRLGLSGQKLQLDEIDSGCAGLAQAFDQIDSWARAGKVNGGYVLVTAANFPSSFMVHKDRYVFNKRLQQPTWLSWAMFGDGAGAIVFKVLPVESRDARAGMYMRHYRAYPDVALMDYPCGGSYEPTSDDLVNTSGHVYHMNAKLVGEQYPIMMGQNLAHVQGRFPDILDESTFILLHQASGVAVKQFGQAIGVPEKVPCITEEYGNMSAASTLVLFDLLRKQSRIVSGDTILWMWIGAGFGGALRGAAIMKI